MALEAAGKTRPMTIFGPALFPNNRLSVTELFIFLIRAAASVQIRRDSGAQIQYPANSATAASPTCLPNPSRIYEVGSTPQT
jgi:hypothetical protein